MKKYENVIWDFNGTILNDMSASMDSVNLLLEERNIPTIGGIDEYREVFGFPIKEYYKKLGFDFEKEPYEVVAPLWVELYTKAAKTAPLRQGALETLVALKQLGVKQYLLSATEINMLNEQVSSLGIKEYFEQVLGLDNIHAESKVSLGNSLKKTVNMSKTLFIGDTLHDYETATAIECDCVLVAGGHQSESRLKTCCENVEKSFETIIKKYF